MHPEISPFINKIIHGNCEEILKKFPDNSVDLQISSPPYDKLRDYHGYTFNFENIAIQMVSILKPGGVIVWVVNDETIKGSESLSSFKQAIFFVESCGLNLHDTMIWRKKSLKYPETTRYYQGFEYMFVFSKGKPKTVNLIKDRKNLFPQKAHGKDTIKDGSKRERNKEEKMSDPFGVRFNIWDFANCGGQGTKDKSIHPARFPEALARDHILSWSSEGDIVLDAMCGSGTTCKMAKSLNRYFIGIDISEEYCHEARFRIKPVGLMNECAKYNE